MSDASIKALTALRDAAGSDSERDWCVAAIAALRAEQPQACAQQDPFAPDGEKCVLPVDHKGHHSAHPWSAHKQPATKVEVPPMPEVWDKHDRGPGSFCHAHDVRALHAAAVRLAEQCGLARREAGAAKSALEHETVKNDVFKEMLKERDEARAQLAEAQEALGVLTTLAGAVPVDVNNPVKMALEIEQSVRAQLAEAQAALEQYRTSASAARAGLAAAVREARRQERERCAKLAYPWNKNIANCIRALPEEVES